MTDCDLDFTTAGVGPVYVRANTPAGRAFLGGPSQWAEGPGTAKECCAEALLGGLRCAVDNHEVYLAKAA